jgi:hypothetical protein
MLLDRVINRGLRAALTHDRWFVDSLDAHPLFPRERTGTKKRERVWA